MADSEGSSEQDDVSFLRTEDMVCLSCNATGERVCLAAEGFGNRTCFLENIADKNNPPDLSSCVFVIEQALSVRALQELVTASANEEAPESSGKGTGSGHRTLLYGNAVLLFHLNSGMYLACLSTSSSRDKLAFDVGLQEHSKGESCWWTIHPASKQRSEGEKVRVGDDLILVSVATERYLQATKEDDQSIVNASFHVTHWSVSPFGTGLSRLKFVACVFGGEVLRFFHGGDECLSIPSTFSDQPGQNIVVYEGGSVTSQARSLWRLELARTKWAGGYINWFHPMRIRHITTGRYLGINNQNDLVLLHREEATLAATAFYLREEKDDNKVILEDKDLEIIGSPLIKYGDSTVIVQHVETGLYLSYRAFEIKKKGVGKVEVKQASLHEEGKMDDGLLFYRSQEEESRTARVIRKCSHLFNCFIKGLDNIQQSRRSSSLLRTVNLKEMNSCLEDLINYFAYPEDELEHEEKQVCLRALRNRQDLFQEEGILNLILDAIDKITLITSQGYLVALAGEEEGQDWDIITGYLYQQLSAVIKGNHTNCAQFANSHRLNWLFSRLGSAGEGTGMLDVLHCVLIDSPEALNVMKEEHIKVIIALLEKYGRDPKVLDVLCSLCVGNGTAVRSSQNNICDYLLPQRNLLLQTQLVDHVASSRPNIFVGFVENSALYRKFYFEVTLDHIEQTSHLQPHLRVGWANTVGYVPYPGGGEKWGGNGVGDDLYSYGFDGYYLWTGGRSTAVNPMESKPYIKKGDVIGCAMDLTVPIITFFINGRQVNGSFTGFNLDGMFFPVISASAKLSARFLLGGEHGRLKYPPPDGHSPVSECLLPFQTLSIDPCFYFGEVQKATLSGPLHVNDDVAFVPKPVDTTSVFLQPFIEQVRDKLAENIHEMWAMNKIEQGWAYGERRDDLRLIHPCLTTFEKLPNTERRYDATLALQTLKTIIALGYHISLDKPPARIRSIRLPNDPFLQNNGYKPAPLDLSHVTLTGKLEELVEQLAENTHNIWARERIQQGWTYGLNEDPDFKRSPHLVGYLNVDDAIKKANRDTASETVRTLLVYGYILEPPTAEITEGETGERNRRGNDHRTYRLEKTLAVNSGKWYFEFEVLTSGPMKVGWACTNAVSASQLGSDDKSWAFDGYNEEKCHGSSSDTYGHHWQVGDVVGCCLDLVDHTVSFSLNGELMMDASGSETAFNDIQGDFFVPACTLGIGQKAKFVFGQDINHLRFFTTYGLQEGYEPFCVNMEKPVTFWYTKDQAYFENNEDFGDTTIDVTRIPAGSETPPCMKIASKMFEATEKANWEFLRLSLPVVCSNEFIDEAEKQRRWQEVKIRQHRIQGGEQRPSSVQTRTIVAESGFTMSDIDELHQGYADEGVEADEMLPKKDPKAKGKLDKGASLDIPEVVVDDVKMPKASSEMNISGKQKTPEPTEKTKKRGKSPFRFFKKRDQSEGRRSKGRTPEPGTGGLRPPPRSRTRNPSVRMGDVDTKIIPSSSMRHITDEAVEETMDAECLKLINEYFFGVRIFPGQDPAHVYVGWVTTQYHIHDTSFDQTKVRSVIVQEYTEEGHIRSSVERHSCYMFSADELHAEVNTEAGGKGASQGMFIGCFIDSATGFITMQCDGKSTRHKYRMEPGTKLFPAVFVEPTSKEVLQFELGRTPTTLPLSAAVLQNSEKHMTPQMPPRLKVQILKANSWSRVPNTYLKMHALKLSDIRGWSLLAEDSVPMLALHIPEEDRCIDILELIESDRLLTFHSHTLALYCAVCYQSNFRAAHTLCSHVDQKQLLYAIQSEYMSGPLRMGFYNMLIALHLESFAASMEVTHNEFIVPLSPEIKEIYSDDAMGNSMSAMYTESVRPVMTISEITNLDDPSYHVKQESSSSPAAQVIKGLSTPYFPLDVVREFVMTALADAVKSNQVHNRDPIGGSNENLYVPLLKLVDNLLLVGVLQDEDVKKLLIMIDPETWDEYYDAESDMKKKGLLQMEIAEGAKLQLSYVIHHLLDIQLRHRVEAIIAFSYDYVGELQADQLRRYIEIKQSDLPSAVAARKTREFRCPPREQMNAILGFKNLTEEEIEDTPLDDVLRSKLAEFHDHLILKTRIPATKEEGEEVEDTSKEGKSVMEKVLGFISPPAEEPVEEVVEEEPQVEDKAEKFQKVLVKTIVRWASDSFIESGVLIREMFSLLLRQYNATGELMSALEKTYVINCNTKEDVTAMWLCLSKVRALLPVQMSQEEEELMREMLWTLVNNHIFFQHPDLIRILRIHENVMAVMMNTLGRRAQTQGESQVPEGEVAGQPKEKDTSHEMVVACCKFLCYFCRTSRQNQKAMFDHLPFLLENSNILLSRPSLRGTTPLDVAYSSLMDNTELALALREHHLEKIAVYLSRCGLQSNSELVERGYPDLGWDPVEGERYLDFLRFCVWVGGEGVEENANLVIRLLIRKPECLGPALRGEGEGLLSAINDSNKMSERINAQRMGAEAEGAIDHPMPAGDDDEDYIDTGAAILNFYCTLVDLMGRCAPEAQNIAQGKNDSLRARAILRSLVPLADLQGVLSLRFSLTNATGEGGSDMPPGLIPLHKQSIVLFLERVYGMDDKDLFFTLLEDAFLPDLRAATMVEKADGSESEMGLALNRYIGNSILPGLIKQSSFYAEAENYAPLLDASLHTVYRLSKCKILTKGQRENVSDFLVALTREMQPAALLPLLRKLTIDVSNLNEYTTVALRLLTLHYERCGKYYGSSAAAAGTATEEEKRLTMMLFTNIFDSLAKMEYDPELFGKALPCLSAIGCALPPDYSLTTGYEDELYNAAACADGPYNPCPIDTAQAELDSDMNDLVAKFSEHYHDAWASRKLENGWTYGENYDDSERHHPRLKPFNMLSDYERERYRDPVREALKALLALNWNVEYESVEGGGAGGGGGREMLTRQDTHDIYDYNPQPVDMTNLTLSREMQTMAERLAENAHDIWAKKKKQDLEAGGGGIHPQMVPYDMLTEKEKRKDRLRSVELIKYLQFMGYRLSRSRGGDESSGAAGAVERRFAYSLLEKLLQYLDCAAINMKILKPSSNLSRRSSFKTSTKDVKFFSKVVLPLMEKYFSTNRSYFLAVSTTTNMTGASSLKEKEMVGSLFCKLANLMRLKFTCFGSDALITVKCLQVMVRCIDAKTLCKSLPEFIRTSMLTFFNNAALDLERTILFLQEGKFAYIRGTHLKTASSLNYIFMVLLPVLTSLYDHTAASEFGQDFLLDEIQVACYKILIALYQLGTDLTLDRNQKFVKVAFDRNRPAIGSCLGAFAATFPVAFMEPMMNKNNQFSIHNRIADQSLEAQEIIVKMDTAMPPLDSVIKDVEKFVDETTRHEDSPHVIDVLLPMLCSYLPFWWNMGPDNVNPSDGNHVSMVTCGHMNVLLRLVLRLIMNNVGNDNAPWMTRIAGYTQQIIINSSEDLLKDPYLPLSERIRKKTEHMYMKEENLRGFLKSSTEDTSQVEGQLQEEWHILVRDIYAFYPLLIKYVDQQRQHWLKHDIVEAEDVYNHVATIFHIWSESQYFRREETNFISQNEIDNMTLIMPTASSRSRQTAVAETSAPSGKPGKAKKKKRSRDKKRDKGKELASSLMVACLKRLLPVGLNLFAGREQELVQHCKEKFLKKITDSEIIEFTKIQLTLPDKIDPSDAMSWQHTLYSRLGGGRAPKQDEDNKKIVPVVDNTVDRIVAMAKVLYGLHIIDHPQQVKEVWIKCVSIQRKRAVIACFRQTSLHMMPRHRAINLFLLTYREKWLSDENVGQEMVIEDLTQSFEEAESKKKEVQEEEGKPDQLTQLVTMFSRKATTEHTGVMGDDTLYMNYAGIMAKSCGEEEEEGDEGGGDDGNEDPAAALNEQELEKQKLLFHQARLANRGVAEMVLLHISASRGQPSDMVMETLKLGISILRGGNIEIQAGMLNYLKEKKDASFFLSISGLMSSCSVLDLDAFERNTKAEGLGVGAEGAAGEKNMHDAEFTCAVFRFIQLTCEGHNLDWQNYLRTQAGNTTTVNVINCTVDYLLRLQESIMDFYWLYSSKEIIDPAGKTNFFKAIEVASQVFNTLTEVIQGPCVGNQQTLAHSRLWDAVGGFLFLFAHMQEKLSKHSCQVDLLKELLNLQKDMVIMMLSMLEGNVVNGTIGKQMVDTLVESASNVELILKYFDMFLKIKDLTGSTNFQELDANHDGTVTPREFKERMEQMKNYTTEEINFLLMCCDTNHDGKIDYLEFTERFHNPAKEIGFNLAVLLTNLSEHMPNDPRLARFLETAGSVLNYFENFLGRIEIMGGSKRIERVYFEIIEDNIEQWEKPQIKESKRSFFHAIVTEGDKEKLEAFVNFCEDAIFEMQHAAALVEEVDDASPGKYQADSLKYLSDDEEERTGMDLIKFQIHKGKDYAVECLSLLSPGNIKKKIKEMKNMAPAELVVGFVKMLFLMVYYSGYMVVWMAKRNWALMMRLMQGPPQEKAQDVKEDKPGQMVPIKMAAMPEVAGAAEKIAAESGLPQPPAKEGEVKMLAVEGAPETKEGETSEEQKVEQAEQQAAPAPAPPPQIEKEEPRAEEAAAPTPHEAKEDEPPPVAQVDLSKYSKRIVSFMARNFYNLKYVALILAFSINFILLFYKASAIIEEEEEGEDTIDNIFGFGSGDLLSGSGDDDILGPVIRILDDDEGIEGSGNFTLGDDDDIEEEDEDPEEWVHMDEKYFYMEHAICTCAVIHSIVSLCMLIAYYHLKMPLVIFKREKDVARRLEFDGIYIAEQPEDDDINSHWDKLVISAKTFPVNYWDKFVKKKVRQKYSETYDYDSISNLLGMETSLSFAHEEEVKGFVGFIKSVDWRYQLWKAGVTITDNSFLYNVWYFSFSILGNINHFFFAAHLMDVAVVIPSLKTILQSVTHNGKQLVLTVMLLTITVYCYTVIAFNFFRKFYVSEEDDVVDQKCHDMLTCFVFHLYKGVRAGGGIGDEIEPPDGDDYEVYRILFDISFFFFIIVILLAIIQGLIIDAFGELRDQLESVKENMESNCFICGIGSDYFDSVPHGFDMHVQKEHNLANYMFFLMHLINKDETEYTGQETYVWSMYQQRCWDFFPVGDCFRKQYEEELSGGGGGGG